MVFTAPPHPMKPAERPAGPAVTLPRVMRAEWIKLRSVRSTTIGFLAAAAVAIVLGLIFSSVAGNVEGPPGGGPTENSDPVSLSLAGFSLAQIVVGVLGVLVVAGEYSTGLIRTTFAAVTTRLPVLWAKVAVVGAVTLAVTGVAALIAFVGGQPVYGGSDPTASLGDPGVLRAVLGTAVYCTGVALIGVALGFLMRSTASAIALLFAGLLVVPGLTDLLPESVSDAVQKLLPSNAGEAFTTVNGGSDLLSPGWGLIVFALWVIGLLTAAAVTLRLNDA